MQIVIRDLSFLYDSSYRALDNVNLDIDDGLFVLVGPNASGKTTLIRVLATLLEPSGGTVAFNGFNLTDNRAEIRAMTGYLPQRFNEFGRVTVAEFLDYSARLAGLIRSKERKAEIDRLLDSLDLGPVKHKNANEISVVDQRHLEIAQAVIGHPRIILMDEPTVGLSPEQRIQFMKLLLDRASIAENIIFSTHIMTDITSDCSGVAILDKGTVSWQGPPDQMPE